MGSPITPVIAIIYMQCFEQQAISMAAKKLPHWYRYVDNMFVIWPHARKSFEVSFSILKVSMLISSALWKTWTWKSTT
jgi:hypothetical protein